MDSKMDKRCPRQLENLPDTWCPLAVQRLKALRHAGRELTEAEEAQLPGCPWAINHQLANYCFFKFIEEHLPNNKNLSEMEIAHFCSLSIDTVKKTEKKALDKIRKSELFQEIVRVYGGDPIVESSDQGEVEWDLPKK